MASLTQLASNILNNINGGYSVTNERFHIEQIKDDIIFTMSRLLDEYESNGKLSYLDIEKMYQVVNCIEVSCKDIAECCNGVKSGEKVLYAKIPSTEKIKYIGHINAHKPYAIVYGNLGIYAAGTKFLKSKPIAWIKSPTEIIIKNPPTQQLKYITVEAIWSDFRELYDYNCIKCKDDDDEGFPISNKFADIITGKLIASYMGYGQIKPIQPNTQADVI